MSVSIRFKAVVKDSFYLSGGSTFKAQLERLLEMDMPFKLDQYYRRMIYDCSLFAEESVKKDLSAIVDAIDKYGEIEIYAEY